MKTAEFLSPHVLTRITLVGAAFLAAVAVLPAFVTEDTGMTMSMQYFVSGTSVLIVVGVALEMVDKLQAQLVMRTYDGDSGQGTQGKGTSAKWANSGDAPEKDAGKKARGGKKGGK